LNANVNFSKTGLNSQQIIDGLLMNASNFNVVDVTGASTAEILYLALRFKDTLNSNY